MEKETKKTGSEKNRKTQIVKYAHAVDINTRMNQNIYYIRKKKTKNYRKYLLGSFYLLSCKTLSHFLTFPNNQTKFI